jgi:uncharacterized protein DUF4105
MAEGELTLDGSPRVGAFRRALRWAGLALLALVVAGMAAWCAGALYYSRRGGSTTGAVLAIVFVVGTAAAFLVLPRRRLTLLGFLATFALVVAWWVPLSASNDRNWLPEVAVTPWASQNGDLVTVHGVRNFDYRTETDFTPRWEDRTYDLRALDSGDLIAVYWAGKAIAHIMVSFGFGGRDYLAVSIETRKARGQAYSTIAGFFKQYELVYVAADERDVIRVRTTFRQPQEDVYVYRLQGPRENLRRVFLDYMKTMNDMHDHPRFYNTLTTNCTTTVLMHSHVNPESPPWSWKVLLSGYLPQYVYELGKMGHALPFAELERQAWVNERAHAADNDPAFSQLIREATR